MKNIFYCLLYFLLFIYIKNQKLESINSDTTQLLSQQNKLFYITNDDNDNVLHIQDLITYKQTNVSISDFKKCKILIPLTDEKFILFGYDSDRSNSKLLFKIFNSNDIENDIDDGNFGNIRYFSKINIRKINETMFLLYFIEGNNLYIYKLNLESSFIISGLKQISKSSDESVNTVECDSFNGEYVICVYSLINMNNEQINYVKYKYFFNRLQDSNINELDISNIENIRAVSVNKLYINDEQKFIMCFSHYKTTDDSSQLKCQIFSEINNQLYIDETKTIDEKMNYNVGESNYNNNIPIKILIYEYTIYILVEMLDSIYKKQIALYSCSLDLGLIIDFYIRIQFDMDFIGTDILINSNNNIIIYEIIPNIKRSDRTTEKTTKIHYIDLSINCANFEQQFTTRDSRKNINNYFVPQLQSQYISFSLDKLTFLEIDGQRNNGGLTEEKYINMNTNFYLIYMNNLQMTHNYYIIYTKFENKFNVPSSNFCYFKIINCYKTCDECHYDILGTSENHQCKNCTANHYKFNNGQNDEGFYNCYEVTDSHIKENLYLENNEEFKYCNESCKQCYDAHNCKSCSTGFYFKVDETFNNIIRENICYADTPEYHYLNISSNIQHNGEIVKFVYKPCFSHCKTCFGDGNENNNNCIDCRDDYIKYPFDERRCTVNKTNCATKYWKVNETSKNIECVDDCDGYIIKNTTNNLNQCVKNCRDFINPYSEFISLISFECGGEKVCITVDECKSRGLEYDIDKCKPDGNSCFFVPRTTVLIIPPTTIPPPSTIYVAPPTQGPTEGPRYVDDHVILIKTFIKNKNYSEVKNNFEKNQFDDYKKELETEFKTTQYKQGLDFITFFKYNDFNITIYPLDVEQYVKDNLFDVNNLCYINFSSIFGNYAIEDEKYNKILIALIEYKNKDYPISTVNYFFMLFNVVSVEGEVINMNQINNNLINISYPLYNFVHDNISDKYSTNLISTIKELNNIDENFNFFDQQNPYYNDICYTDNFQKDIDISIKDRIKEYYIQISFCEKDCSFKYIYDKEKNPKSLCECQLKQEININQDYYTFNTTEKEKESVSNIKALTCFKEVSKKLSSNPSFWVYLIIIFINIALFISIIFCGKKAIENMLKTKKRGNRINLNEEVNNNINMENNNNNNNNNINSEEVLNINKKKNKNKSNISSSVNNKESINSAEDNESKKEISEGNPPKKLSISSNKNTETTGNNKLQTNKENETSLFESDLNYNLDKDSGFEDIFDDIGNTNQKVNNYVINEKNIKKDNYIYLQKVKLFLKIKQSIPPLDKKEFNKYKYINTINENNDIKQNRNINITGLDIVKKNYYSTDDIKMNNKHLNLINYSYIKNKGTQKLSKFSKLFGEESMISGNEKLLQAGNILNNNNNNNYNDNYEKNLKENNNNNNNNSLDDSNISEKKEPEIDSQNSLVKNKKKSLVDSSYENSETRKIKNSLNASINSDNKLLSKNNRKITEDNKNNNLNNQLKVKEETYKKSVLSSSESDIDESILDPEKKVNCCYLYCDYFVQREIFLSSFYNKHDNISLFIRLPTFFIVICFIFTLNCLYLTESDIHNRYEYYNEHGKINEFKYVFENDKKKILIIALLSNVFKMICIKLVYFVVFKVSSEMKEEISPFSQRNLTQTQKKELNKKKKKYLRKYKIRSIIFMIIIFILLLVFGYVCTCYIGTFPKAIYELLITFIFSVIISFIICAILCFIVSIFYCGGCHKIFKVLSVIY